MSKSYKTEERKTSLYACVNDAFAEIESLRDEMQDIVDNMSSNNMEHLPKYETAENAVTELDEHVEAPDVDGDDSAIGRMEVTYQEMVNRRKGRAASRDVRLSNATAMIAAAIDTIEAQIQKLEELRDALNEHSDISVEFPGMYG
jgi:hypothetical protein